MPGSLFSWRKVNDDPLIYEAEPRKESKYLLIRHEELWAVSKMTGRKYKRGSTLSPRPEPMPVALERAHRDWANDQALAREALPAAPCSSSKD